MLPRGLLSNVVNVAYARGKTTASLRAASVYEVAPNFQFDVPLTSSTQAFASDVTASCGPASGLTPYRHIKNVSFSGGWDTVSVLGHHIVDGVKAAVHFTADAGLNVTAGAGLACSLSASFYASGMAGPIPVTAGIEGDLSGSAAVGGILNGGGSVRVKAGAHTVGVPPSLLWSPDVSFGDPKFTFNAKSFAQATAGIGLTVKAGIGNGNLASVTLNIGTSLNFSAQPGACEWNAKFGQFSAEGQLLKWHISTPKTPALFTHQLWHNSCGGRQNGGGTGGGGGGSESGASGPEGGEGEGSGPAGPPGQLGWTVEPLATATGIENLALFAVSCSDANACMGVGYSEGGEPRSIRPLAEAWNGSSWAISSIGDSNEDVLDGVSCPTANWCAAVGSRGGGNQAVAETWNGSSWTERTIPAPPDSQAYTLSGVSCISPSHCIAVGYYIDDIRGAAKALAESWNGSSWTESDAVAPNPSGPPYDENSELRSVSCATATSCVAVGEYEDELNHTDPALAESWNGDTWAVDPTPAIPDSFQTYLNGVSCWTSNSCMAVGAYVLPGEGNTVSEKWDGSEWHLLSAPMLPETFSELHAVSCTSATFCVGLGYGSPGASYIALWRGMWSYEAFATALNAVSCVSETYCVAVGSGAAVYKES